YSRPAFDIARRDGTRFSCEAAPHGLSAAKDNHCLDELMHHFCKIGLGDKNPGMKDIANDSRRFAS
ncbi:MAG: hypothetical protein EBY09_21585, partial [Verrucomicrobia bacterium]|nr:hypothetical protein [Verrucomicrobiota bacterium]NDF01482.1 hypothetical protein [Verrucomicrobiota bacterium]